MLAGGLVGGMDSLEENGGELVAEIGLREVFRQEIGGVAEDHGGAVGGCHGLWLCEGLD